MPGNFSLAISQILVLYMDGFPILMRSHGEGQLCFSVVQVLIFKKTYGLRYYIYIITLITFSGKVLERKKINTSKPPGMVQFNFSQLTSVIE